MVVLNNSKYKVVAFSLLLHDRNICYYFECERMFMSNVGMNSSTLTYRVVFLKHGVCVCMC